MEVSESPRIDTTLEVDGYKVTDSVFGQPYIDRDEWRETPYPHRNVHGGFSGCDTRFTCYFPDEKDYQSRMFHPIEGAHAGHEDAFDGLMGQMLGGLAMIARLGGYMVESNSGHIGDTIDPAVGVDPTVYGHRASVESARLSKYLAAQVYGEAPRYSYVWGGSGGGRRSPLCLEYGGDVYDGALPFMGGGAIAEHGTSDRIRSEQPVHFGCMFNVQRLLGDKIHSVVDAMRPGGSGNPFAGLTSHQREELDSLYRLGYPRGDEFMIAEPMGQIWLWSSIADMLQEEGADYFSSFWSKPGYVGFDNPEYVNGDLINCRAKVKKVVTASELLQSPEFAGPEYARAKPMAMMMAAKGPDFPLAVQLEGMDNGYLLGTGVKVLTGAAAGRQLYCTSFASEVLFCDGRDDANILRFTGVQPGDEVQVDNRAFLAFCYYYRHHVSDDPANDFLCLDGVPIYPQHDMPLQSPHMGVAYSGKYEGKLMWIHHTHDASLWPPQGVIYRRAVEMAQGEKGLEENFCLRWTENAEHVPPAFLPSAPDRATTTWLVDYMPHIEQGLVDLTEWVEQGKKPAETHYTFADGRVVLPDTAAKRKGIQPVLSLLANGGARADVAAGTSVEFVLNAEVPTGAGGIIAIEWDWLGKGEFTDAEDLTRADERADVTRQRVFDTVGSYFVTAKVTSHRDGDFSAVSRRVSNLVSVRVVVN
ncbi:tannase/feruloyl esterase family alpha/beta hydrolase [Spongiibacter sp. KMU-166]|uniref:Tannase/feruloyl esterase family alpha/beta hydrolase n=1 Tax=Spongiibacter thalassae TaxID=2721624 RepID=A0ABX1GBA3_9GAMM|nr:tannase/feruloyl esterase family alpha/beta hydrolase [Spongiibacter thalassae]NKI16439.1 tannase/feruloyl esterase family alpha/beta hydrolase [Spongiibacter thalassae]